MITHNEQTNTWQFTVGSKSYTGFASREQAAEALYDAERGKAPDPLIACLDCIDQFEDDEPAVTVLDNGAIFIERFDRPNGDCWLKFSIGERFPSWCSMNVNIVGDKPGVDLIVAGVCLNEGIDEVWTVADVERLHRDLGRLLAAVATQQGGPRAGQEHAAIDAIVARANTWLERNYGSIPSALGPFQYETALGCREQVRQLNSPWLTSDKALHPIIEMVSYLTRPETVAAMLKAWATVDDDEEEQEEHAAAPVVTVERHDEYAAPCWDYCCGNVTLEVLDDPSVETPGVGDGSGITIWNFGSDCCELAQALRDVQNLQTLLNDPRVQSIIAARRPTA